MIIILIILLVLIAILLIKHQTRYWRDPMPEEYLKEIEENAERVI